MANATGRIVVIGVPPRHDGTCDQIREINSLLALDSRFGYKYIGVSCFLSNKSVLGRDKVHLEAEGKAKLNNQQQDNMLVLVFLISIPNNYYFSF